MLFEESIWINTQLRPIVHSDFFPSLNIGSSTARFRKEVQSHIHENIFRALEEQGKVVHLDVKEDEGVDICGDLNDPGFVESLKNYRFRSVFCNNLMMHLEEPARLALAAAIMEILQSSGYLVISTSHVFPYTPDPYDSYFRPGISELHALFPDMELINGAIVKGSGSFGASLIRNPVFGLKMLLRLFLPFYHNRAWRHLVAYLPRLNEKYSAVCLILRKKE